MRVSLETRRNNLRKNINSDIREIGKALRDATSDIRGRASEVAQLAIDNARAKSLAARDTAEDYIHEKPFRTVGVALLVGFLLGFIYKRK